MERDRYQVSLWATNLPNKGWFRTSSLYATIKIVSGPQQGTELGRTEIIEQNPNPDWCKIFFLEFSRAEITLLEITIYDRWVGKSPLWIGEGRFEAASVCDAAGNTRWEQIGRAEDSR
jgi:C2 domain